MQLQDSGVLSTSVEDLLSGGCHVCCSPVMAGEKLHRDQVDILCTFVALAAVALATLLWRFTGRSSSAIEHSQVRNVNESRFEANYRQLMPRAVVFLNVDGVLNSLLIDDPLGLLPGQVDPQCVQQLAALLGASSAALVLSSSWRSSNELKRALLWALEHYGYIL